MGIRRSILYAGYGMLKISGLLRLMNRGTAYGNILVFHRVNDYDRSALTTETGLFDAMMRTLSREYRVAPLQDLIAKVALRKKLSYKTVAITFDDGYRDNYLCAAPILKKYRLPATFFVTSGYINTTKTFPWERDDPIRHALMTWDEVRDLVRMGHDIGAHTVNHVNLGQVSPAIAREEILGSKARIEKEIRCAVHAFAFPFGKKECIRPEVVEIVKQAGFDCCCSAYGGKVFEKSDQFNLLRIPAYPSVVEMAMELDNFMTYFDREMHFHILNRPHEVWRRSGAPRMRTERDQAHRVPVSS